MNLIEQLGGYGKAKKALIDAQNGNDIDPIIYINDQEVLTDCVCDALIQYRRANNIFEVGDWVFYTGRANDADLYCLKEVYDKHNFAVGSNGADKDFWTLFLEEIRHATPKEIEQGYRDE